MYSNNNVHIDVRAPLGAVSRGGSENRGQKSSSSSGPSSSAASFAAAKPGGVRRSFSRDKKAHRSRVVAPLPKSRKKRAKRSRHGRRGPRREPRARRRRRRAPVLLPKRAPPAGLAKSPSPCALGAPGGRAGWQTHPVPDFSRQAVAWALVELVAAHVSAGTGGDAAHQDGWTEGGSSAAAAAAQVLGPGGAGRRLPPLIGRQWKWPYKGRKRRIPGGWHQFPVRGAPANEEPLPPRPQAALRKVGVPPPPGLC